jgi:hypothetical protein
VAKQPHRATPLGLRLVWPPPKNRPIWGWPNHPLGPLGPRGWLGNPHTAKPPPWPKGVVRQPPKDQNPFFFFFKWPFEGGQTTPWPWGGSATPYRLYGVARPPPCPLGPNPKTHSFFSFLFFFCVLGLAGPPLGLRGWPPPMVWFGHPCTLFFFFFYF